MSAKGLVKDKKPEANIVAPVFMGKELRQSHMLLQRAF